MLGEKLFAEVEKSRTYILDSITAAYYGCISCSLYEKIISLAFTYQNLCLVLSLALRPTRVMHECGLAL